MTPVLQEPGPCTIGATHTTLGDSSPDMRSIKPALAVLLLAGMVPSGALGDQRAPQPTRRSTRVCYCGCNMKDAKMECTKMCELPKYEKRPWATSCRKRQARPLQLRQPSSQPPSPSWGPENARR